MKNSMISTAINNRKKVVPSGKACLLLKTNPIIKQMNNIIGNANCK